MPFPLLAHQAPILSLKLWRPAWFSGTALVFGSVAPDLEFLASPFHFARGFTHSAAGQLLFCVPLTLLVGIYLGRCHVGAALAARLRWRLVPQDAGLLKMTTSALIGSSSHVALDAFTHNLVPAQLHSQGSWRWHAMSINTASLAQLAVTVLLSIIGVAIIARLFQRAPELPVTEKRGRRVLVVVALVGAAAGTWRTLPAIRDPNRYYYLSHIYVWGDLLFHVACGIGASWLIVGGFLAWHDARARTNE